MDDSSLANLASTIAADAHPRRAITRALAALPLASAAALLVGGGGTTAARGRHRRQAAAHAEKKHKKKPAPYCLNGQTVNATKKNRRKLVQQGATAGACTAAPPSQPCTRVWTAQTAFGVTGSGDGQFKEPQSIALSADTLTMWVAEVANGRIAVWTRASASATWAQATTFGSSGSDSDHFSGPIGMAAAADTLSVWVAELGNNRVSVWTRPGASSTAWENQTTFGSGPGDGSTQFQNPMDVATSRDGLTAWVADQGNNRITVWTRPSASSDVWSWASKFGSLGSEAHQFVAPRGIVASADGLTVWVADTLNSRISVWSRASATSTNWLNQTSFGSQGSATNQFTFPRGLALSPDELTLWVADSNNSRISIWSRPNTGSNAWAPVTAFGGVQGTRPNELWNPTDVAVSPDGRNAWIADATNDRIAAWSAVCPA